MKLNNKILRILQNQKLHSPVLNLYRTYKTLPLPQLHNNYYYFILMLMHKFNYNRNLLPTLFFCYTSPKIFKFMDTTLGKPIFYTSIVKKQQRARDLSNLKVEMYGMTYRRQFEFIGGKYTFQRKLKLYLLNRIDN